MKQGELFDDAAWSSTEMSNLKLEIGEGARGSGDEESGGARPRAGPDGIGAGRATRAMTDEEILGLGAEENGNAADENTNPRDTTGLLPGETRNLSKEIPRPGETGTRKDSVGEGQREGKEVGTEREAPPEWMQPLLADAKVAPHLQDLWNEHRSLRAIDTAYYSGDARAQTEMARQLYADNPAAFRSMVTQAARLLAPMESGQAGPGRVSHRGTERTENAAPVPSRLEGGGTEGANRSPVPMESGQVEDSAFRGEDPTLAREREELQRQRGEFRAEQFAAFQQAANESVTQQVRQNIERVVQDALAADVADGARQRIAADIYTEVGRALAADPALTERVAALLRQWRFDEATKQQVVNLIFGRARAILPAVAKRVIGEWTSSVLSARRHKTEKQQAAARRVDIVGGGAVDAVSRRALSPRDINYSQTSDDAILNL